MLSHVMADAPPKEDDKLPEREAEARFNKLVGNLVNTPHKPHKDQRHERTKPRGKGRD